MTGWAIDCYICDYNNLHTTGIKSFWAPPLTIDKVKKRIEYHFPYIEFNDKKERKFCSVISIIPVSSDISRLCPIAKRQHASNIVYFEACTLTRLVYVKCFDPDCKGTKIVLDPEPAQRVTDNLTTTSSRSSCKRGTKRKASMPGCLPYYLFSTDIKYIHDTITMQPSDVLELYDSLNFVYTRASKEVKRPLDKGWVNFDVSSNKHIDFDIYNVAVVTGANSNLCVVDIDVKDNGLEWFRAFCSDHKYNYTASTMCVQTPSGGVHLYYQYNENLDENRVRMKDTEGNLIGLDLRSSNGCVIAPPSSYPSGSYQFMCLKRPKQIPTCLLSAFGIPMDTPPSPTC